MRKKIDDFPNYEITENGEIYSLKRFHNSSDKIDIREKKMIITNVPNNLG